MSMERLPVGGEDPYDPIEASIHVGRYALALPFAAGRRVLDIACGEGYGAWLLAKFGAAEVVGVDISEEAVAKARANFQSDGLSFRSGPAETLAQQLPAGHFDLVVSIETIEHVEDATAYLRAIKALARPDAVFVLTCPNDHWYYGAAEGNPHHRRRLTLAEFQALTTSILGDSVQWLLGSSTLGFSAMPAAPPGSEPPRVVQVSRPCLSLRVPSGMVAPSPTNCSYFVGVWNVPEQLDGAGAYHVLSMDAYSRFFRGDALEKQLGALEKQLEETRAALAAAETRVAAAKAEAATERREREIVGLQAAALRRENDILATSITVQTSARQAAEQQHAAANEALAWHAARLQSLEMAGAGFYLRRAVGRTLMKSPPLHRLALKLRGRLGGN